MAPSPPGTVTVELAEVYTVRNVRLQYLCRRRRTQRLLHRARRLVHRCDLTRRVYELPVGEPAPHLAYDAVDQDGHTITTPGDPFLVCLHPDLIDRPSALRLALETHAEYLRERAADLLSEALLTDQLLERSRRRP